MLFHKNKPVGRYKTSTADSTLFFNVLHVESLMMNDFSVGVGVDGGIGV